MDPVAQIARESCYTLSYLIQPLVYSLDPEKLVGSLEPSYTFILQPDQIIMAVLFCYPVKSDARVRYCIGAYTGLGTRTTRPCLTGLPVCSWASLHVQPRIN